MANRKKISELDIAQSISGDDLFVVVDPNTDTGNDASSTGKTNKVTLNTIKNSMFPAGAPIQFWNENSNNIFFNTGNVGIGTDNPSTTLEVNGSTKIKGGFYFDSPDGFISLLQKHTGDELRETLHTRTDGISISSQEGLTSITKAEAHTETFTIPGYPSPTDNEPSLKGVRYYIKIKHLDAEGGTRFAINDSSDFSLSYDRVQGSMNDNSFVWSTFDITEYMQTSNTLYFWSNTVDGGWIYDRYVFASSGIALPNEPVEQNQIFTQGLTSFGDVGIVNPSAGSSAMRIARSTDTGNQSNYLLDIREESDSHSTFDMQAANGISTVRLKTSGDSFLMGGNVGIGTQAPKFGLDIKDKNGIAVRDPQAAQNSQTNMIRTTTSSVTHDDWGVGINVVNEDPASNGYGMAFWTRSAYNGSYSEKVRISRSGEVGIGNTASNGNYKLNVTGNIFASGNIVADGSITTQDFQVNGDFAYSGTMYNIGTEVSDLHNVCETNMRGIETLNKIHVCDYTINGKKVVGYVSQDIKNALPSAVSEIKKEVEVCPSKGNIIHGEGESKLIVRANVTKSDFEKQSWPETYQFEQTHDAETEDVTKLAVSQDQLIATLIKSVQELNAKVDSLTAEVREKQ